MKIEKIEYWKLKTDRANFNNEKIGLTVSLGKGESAQEALDRARRWVEKQFLRCGHLDKISTNDYDEAITLIEKVGRLDEDLPF